jgi:hypothetical protein
MEHDPETGELPLSNGAKAATIAANTKLAMRAMEMGIGNRSLNDAIENALKEIPIWIQATQSSGRGNAKYATLKEILTAVRPVLLAHRVRIRQGADRSYGCDEGGGSKGRLVPVYTDLVHTVTGETERTQIEMPLTRLDPQAMGSAITYGKRYSILAALGLATDEADDDGARAMPRDVTAAVQKTPLLDILKAELSKAKEPEDLMKIGADAKFKKRANDLSDDEGALLREFYSELGRKLIGTAE